ncbi:hypothetical protein Y032_0050g1902 [Ancylostoma ceylanicum]|uniref:Uncharacterized protein n=1 Tax=Ancylostoma ceylanicum TaxID=53326 RepID=A0A016U910_9BILA|nr:hypothetical protein Y032_0050g1902 [Ancylostoma ceylanicum]
MSAFQRKQHAFLQYQAAVVYVIVAIVGFVKLGAISSDITESTIYDLTTHCYYKYWRLFNLENFVPLLPYIAERCAPSFSVMDVYRFGDEDDWRYSMIPKSTSNQKKCHGFVFVGLSHGLAVELQVNCRLNGVCCLTATWWPYIQQRTTLHMTLPS